MQQSSDAQKLENRFGAKIKDRTQFATAEKYSGFEHPNTPVIIDSERGYIQHFYWGLIPQWANNDDIKNYTLNARIESLKDKPSFKDSVNKRCLVITSGFYEWQWEDKKGKKKTPYFITTSDDEPFAFAGIYSNWLDKSTGEIIKTYSIVTTAANELMRKIHNSKQRMPVILNRGNEQEWLNGMSLQSFEKSDIELKATNLQIVS